jgi:hypothetical protein
MTGRRFPRPWRFEPIPGGYRVLDANGVTLAIAYGQPDAAVGFSESRLTDEEAQRIARLITRLPELVELERERHKAKSRRPLPPPTADQPTGDAGRYGEGGKSLLIVCSSCKPARHVYVEAGKLDLPKRMPVPEVKSHLVCSVCGARNGGIHFPISVEGDNRGARVSGEYPNHGKK